MNSRHVLAMTLAAAIAFLPTIALAQQATGTLSGVAAAKFTPTSDYTVVLRNAATGQIVATTTLGASGTWTFDKVALNQQYLVELVSKTSSAQVCTKGPYSLAKDQITIRNDVKFECGKSPAILWLLAAGAGTAATVAGVATASPSR
jgi:hypothetical protein